MQTGLWATGKLIFGRDEEASWMISEVHWWKKIFKIFRNEILLKYLSRKLSIVLQYSSLSLLYFYFLLRTKCLLIIWRLDIRLSFVLIYDHKKYSWRFWSINFGKICFSLYITSFIWIALLDVKSIRITFNRNNYILKNFPSKN